jgi:hypothetical protein
MAKPSAQAPRSRNLKLVALEKLAFRELEPLASALLSVLLALVLAGVTGEEAGLLELRAKFPIEFDQGARDSETDCVSLTSHAAAMGKNQDVELFCHLGDEKRLPNRDAQGFGREVVVERTPVDGNIALAGPEKYTRNRRFAATGSKVLLNLSCGHS